jgi:hydroxymethylbilane synthase
VPFDVDLWVYQQRGRRPDGIQICRICLQRMRSVQLLELWSMTMKASLKIGTRASKLALWQANWVKSALIEKFPSLAVDLVTIKTKGDKILDVPLANVGGKGLFVKEIEEALLDGRVDLAVHSMKDMPAELPQGLCVGPIPKRETPSDVLISRENHPLAQLSHRARIGTSSLRRAAQLRHARPDLSIVPLRGNLDTRLKKLDAAEDDLDAIVLAAAGVKRLGLENRITEYLDSAVMLPAVGQGALCIEIRENNPEVAEKLDVLNHPSTRAAVLGERAFLKRLEGSCQIPIAAHGTIKSGQFILDGLVSDIDGESIIRDSRSGSEDASEQIGVDLAEHLLSLGAGEILEKLLSAGTKE